MLVDFKLQNVMSFPVCNRFSPATKTMARVPKEKSSERCVNEIYFQENPVNFKEV